MRTAKLENFRHDLLTSGGEEYDVPAYCPRAGFSVDDVVAELGGRTVPASAKAERRAAVDSHAVIAAVYEDGMRVLVLRAAEAIA